MHTLVSEQQLWSLIEQAPLRTCGLPRYSWFGGMGGEPLCCSNLTAVTKHAVMRWVKEFRDT